MLLPPPWEDAWAESEVLYNYWVTACNSLGGSDYAGPVTGWAAPQPPERVWVPTVRGGAKE